MNAEDNSGSTALFYSFSAGNPEVMSYLLQYGADALHVDNKGRNPLHFMTQNSNSPYARLLLEAGTDPSGRENTSGETALHIASGAGAWELAELYLSNGSQGDINVSSRKGGTPLFYALKPEIPLSEAMKTIRILLDSGADPNIPSAKEILPIVFAVENSDVPIIEMLINSGVQMDIRLPKRKTLLHIAVSRDIPELVSILIDEGINPNLKDQNGNTALFNALEKGFVNSAEILLAKGADPNVINNAGKSTLLISLERDAGKKQGLSAMTNLLIRYNAFLLQAEEILTDLLVKTLESGNADVAEYLLISGANPDKTVQKSMTLLMLASKNKFIEISRVLLEQGARVNMRDNEGNTAMHRASQAGFVQGVELLLHYGENPDPVNYEKKRPIELAPENDQGARIIEILLASGAQPLPVITPPEVESPPEGEIETSVSEDESTIDIVIGDEIWNKAEILAMGGNEPKGISDIRMTFPGYTSQVPQSYPGNLISKSNPKEVLIYLWNDSAVKAEIYKVKTDSNIEPVSILPSGKITEIKTRQGNVFPIYTGDNLYFGEIRTTGQDKQYYRLVPGE